MTPPDRIVLAAQEREARVKREAKRQRQAHRQRGQWIYYWNLIIWGIGVAIIMMILGFAYQALVWLQARGL
jgi:hypothetical protein